MPFSTETHLDRVESAKQITRNAKLANADLVAAAMEDYYLLPDMADQQRAI